MELTEQQKEELFLDFAVKFAEMDKEDKNFRTANNNAALKHMSKYYAQEVQKLKKDPRAYDMKGFFRFYGVYNAYLELRHATIYLVNAKKSHDMKPQHMNMLDRDKDVEEAEKAGTMLIDAMMHYLLDDSEDGVLGDATYFHA
jgi:hypothetical protein